MPEQFPTTKTKTKTKVLVGILLAVLGGGIIAAGVVGGLYYYKYRRIRTERVRTLLTPPRKTSLKAPKHERKYWPPSWFRWWRRK